MKYNIGMNSSGKWEKVIRPHGRLLQIDIKGLWAYRDLVLMLIKRDFVTQYKQTILGPAWAVIKPLLTTLVFTVFFGGLAKLTTADAASAADLVLPGFLFYMLGTVVWDYFSAVVSETSTLFIDNQQIMGKVYFPRLVMPVTIALSKLISFVIQFALFIAIYAVCAFAGLAEVHLSWTVLLFPVLMLELMLLAASFGMLISALTVKYRDMQMMLGFFMQLWRYGSPLAYGLLLIPETWRTVYLLNPFAPVVTAMRCVMFGEGFFDWRFYALSWVTVCALAMIGLAAFNKTERTFIDTV